jgi:hypothetical protein
MNSQQKRDVLYLKRTPTVTYDSTSGAPIPESIKKFYVQQQLPVRKQSLAASHFKHDVRKRVHQQSLPRHHSHIPKTNTTHLSHIVEDLAVGNILEEQDEFTLKDRPPSSVISIRPIDLDDEDEEVENIDWNTLTTTTPVRRKLPLSLLFFGLFYIEFFIFFL